MKYMIKCDKCKKVMSFTDDIKKSYAGGHCISCQDKAGIGTDSWYQIALEGINVSDSIKKASVRICQAYGISGQADPGYIANLINHEVSKAS